jgi:hypothetical protein
MIKSVPQALADLGKLYEERNALYQDNYKNFGRTLLGLFPNGITLKSEEDFNRFALYIQLIHKPPGTRIRSALEGTLIRSMTSRSIHRCSKSTTA